MNMVAFGKKVVKFRIPILIISILLSDSGGTWICEYKSQL